MTQGQGKVFLVGAGPGDPGLLTLKAVEILRSCDLVVYDYLVNPAILSYANPKAALLYVGKRAGFPSIDQQEINRILIDQARAGRLVARLKGGDPFVFGRGGEEAEALAAHQIPWEVVPGVSSGVAAAAYAGIPLTHRQYASSVAFITGQEKAGSDQIAQWRNAARLCGLEQPRHRRAFVKKQTDKTFPLGQAERLRQGRQGVVTALLGRAGDGLQDQYLDQAATPSG